MGRGGSHVVWQVWGRAAHVCEGKVWRAEERLWREEECRIRVGGVENVWRRCNLKGLRPSMEGGRITLEGRVGGSRDRC